MTTHNRDKIIATAKEAVSPDTTEYKITGSPKEIWLNYGDIEYDDTHENCAREGEITWCEESVFDSDVKYIRADLVGEDYEANCRDAWEAGAASRDAEVAELKAELETERCLSFRNQIAELESERDQLREQVTMLRDSATRAHRKLSAYVGVCTGDKELTNTIIPMLKEALDSTEMK